MLVLVAPGQGSQTPGFLLPWLDLPGAAERLGAWSEVVKLDLVHYGTKADEDEIRDTAVAQPLIVAASLLSAAVLFDPAVDVAPAPAASPASAAADAGQAPPLPAPREVVGATAGHSVGELTAAALAGVISEEDALMLVARRGRAMAEAAATTETGMSAVLGGDPQEVAACLERLGLIAANVNGGGQVVAAGTVERLARLPEEAPAPAKVRPLKVAGAFHTHHMAPAVAAMEAAVAGLRPADPGITYVSNADGRVVSDGAQVLRRLVNQVSSPVRWDLCMETLGRLGATAQIELCPGDALTGLTRRSLPQVQRVAVKTPAHVAKARKLIAALSAE